MNECHVPCEVVKVLTLRKELFELTVSGASVKMFASSS